VEEIVQQKGYKILLQGRRVTALIVRLFLFYVSDFMNLSPMRLMYLIRRMSFMKQMKQRGNWRQLVPNISKFSLWLLQVKKRQVLTWQRLDEESSMHISCVYKFSKNGTMETRKLEHTNELSGSRFDLI
jgi:hypothetical protein